MQAVKDPLKTKGPRLSMQLSIAGRYLVYVPQGEGIGVSRRLDDKERERLRKPGQGPGARRGRRHHPHRRPGGQEGRLPARDQVPAQAPRGAAEAREGDRPRRPWSSRRPTCRCAWCATSSRSSSSARSSTTPSSTTGWSRSSPAPRRSCSSAWSSYKEPRSPLFERYGIEEAIQSHAAAARGPALRRLPADRVHRGDDGDRHQLGLVHGPRQGRPARGHDHQDQPRGGRRGRAPAAAARHRRHHRHRLHRHVAGRATATRCSRRCARRSTRTAPRPTWSRSRRSGWWR